MLNTSEFDTSPTPKKEKNAKFSDYLDQKCKKPSEMQMLRNNIDNEIHMKFEER